MPFVSICLSSAEVRLEKPDPEIFMIGDRLDTDVRPCPAAWLENNTHRPKALPGFSRPGMAWRRG
jgi:FMN phosphatase YigB (HAD superfamily)